MDQLSVVDRVKNRLRTNPIVAAVVTIGFVVVWVATFTDAIRKLKTLLPGPSTAAVAGRWDSPKLKDLSNGHDYRYVLDLRVDGARVTGTARRIIVACERAPGSGICDGQGRPVPLRNGTVDHQGTAFDVDWGELPGAVEWSWTHVKEQFRGRPDPAGLRFSAQDDRNNPPVDFVATRASTPDAAP